MRILLPVDGSDHSRHAIRFVADRVEHATVELLNVQHTLTLHGSCTKRLLT